MDKTTTIAAARAAALAAVREHRAEPGWSQDTDRSRAVAQAAAMKVAGYEGMDIADDVLLEMAERGE